MSVYFAAGRRVFLNLLPAVVARQAVSGCDRSRMAYLSFLEVQQTAERDFESILLAARVFLARIVHPFAFGKFDGADVLLREDGGYEILVAQHELVLALGDG